MKKMTIVSIAVIAILTMLFSFLPMSTAYAEKEDTIVGLLVRNRTDGIVEIKLVDENGNPSWFTYGPGQTTTPLPEGKYFYYATTPCGNQSGDFNINVTKQLIFDCKEGLEIELTVPVHKGVPGTSEFCYPVFDYTESTVNGDKEFAIGFIWGPIGTHCQPNQANTDDTIQYYNSYWDETNPYYYLPDGHMCYPNGNGYYFPCEN